MMAGRRAGRWYKGLNEFQESRFCRKEKWFVKGIRGQANKTNHLLTLGYKRLGGRNLGRFLLRWR